MRENYECMREGTRNLFPACELLADWRRVELTNRRTKKDSAHQMRWLAEETYPDALVIRLVLDNLNTHRIAASYQTFRAEEVRRIAMRLELHHTPMHSNWFNPVLSLLKE